MAAQRLQATHAFPPEAALMRAEHCFVARRSTPIKAIMRTQRQSLH
jgi:hypothetical protein